MITTVVEVLATVADTLMLVWFIPAFLGVSPKKRLWTLIIPVLQLAVQLSFDWLMPGFSLLPMVIMLLLVFAFAVSLSPKTFWWDALASVAHISLMMLISSFVFSVFSFFIDNMGEIMQGTNSKVRILYIIIAKLVLFSCYKFVLILFKKSKNIETPNAVLSLVLTVGTAVALSALMKIAALDDTGSIDIPIFIIAFIICLVNLILYVFIYQIQKLQKSRFELKLINERVTLEKKQSEDANAIWSNIRKVRHDLKNHFSVIKGYLEQGEPDACYDYINSIQQTVESMGTLIRSGNSIVDYLINSKLSNLEDVQVLITGCIGDFNDIKDSDMVCILGNILDNAVEALQKVSGKKKIELYFSKVKQNRIIVCKNSIERSVLETNENLVSTKEDASLHGLGHQIVESTAKRYGGLVGYFEEDGMFGVQVVIPKSVNL